MHKTCYLFRSAISDQFVRSPNEEILDRQREREGEKENKFKAKVRVDFSRNQFAFGTELWHDLETLFSRFNRNQSTFSLILLKCFCDVFWVNIITGVVTVWGKRGGGEVVKAYSINSENLLL